MTLTSYYLNMCRATNITILLSMNMHLTMTMTKTKRNNPPSIAAIVAASAQLERRKIVSVQETIRRLVLSSLLLQNH